MYTPVTLLRTLTAAAQEIWAVHPADLCSLGTYHPSRKRDVVEARVAIAVIAYASRVDPIAVYRALGARIGETGPQYRPAIVLSRHRRYLKRFEYRERFHELSKKHLDVCDGVL